MRPGKHIERRSEKCDTYYTKLWNFFCDQYPEGRGLFTDIIGKTRDRTWNHFALISEAGEWTIT